MAVILLTFLAPQTLPSRCHQCVIVTSSSHLLGTKLGPEIERAECTIRMNDAPTTGYSADVGNKTTFRVVAHSSVFRVLRRPQEFVNRTPETVFIFWGPPSKMQKPQGSLVRVIQRAGLAFPSMEAYAVSPARMQQFDDLFRGETGKDRYQPPTCPLWPALRSFPPSACSSGGPEAPCMRCSEVVAPSGRPRVRSPWRVLFTSRTCWHSPGGLLPSSLCEGRWAPSMLCSKAQDPSSIFPPGEQPSLDYSQHASL